MDFFARQDQARKKTRLLVFYFIVAVVLIITLIYFVVLFGFTVSTAEHQRHSYQSEPVQFYWWNLNAFLAAVFGTLAVVFFGSAWKTSQLSGGGGIVAGQMGGRLVSQGTADADERKLLNVVEEMSIAAGVPMPQVYVLDCEEGINAFAAGHSPSDAAIGVTRGCIQMLSRDELQGVIGHEFSHVLNGDMRLNIRLLGVIFGILCLATIGRILLNARGGSRDKNPLPFLGIALLIIGGIGVFFGRLIQSAVSRQREFLADASSVQFTRNPGGLSGALQKIGIYSYGSKLESEHAPDMCHMFFSNGLSAPLFNLMATHPPIPDRIHAIDETWDGKYPALKPEQFETVKRAALGELKPSPLPGIMRNVGIVLAGTEAVENARPQSPVIRSQNVLSNVGKLTPLHLKYAVQLRDALPENLKAAARAPLGAATLIYALLLSPDEKIRSVQLAGLAQKASPDLSEKAAALFPDVVQTAKNARLPLVNLALGALRNLTPEQFAQFSQTLQWLAGSDGKIELFEFVLQKIIRRHLASKFGTDRSLTVQFYTLKPLVPDCVLLLSALACAGSADACEIQKAFSAGVPYLRAPADAKLELLPETECGVDRISVALDRLAVAAPIIKKNLIEACVHTVGADGVVQENEAELLRAISDTLDCPMPPMLGGN